MVFTLKISCFTLLCIFLIYAPALCHSKLVGSKATFYKQPDGMGTPDGACGYKDYGRTVNDGAVCTVSNKLFNNGAGCGSCYNVICTNKALCSSAGTKVVATDNGGGPAGSDFICSYLAFTKLAKPGKESELVKKGVIDVVYEKVACNYPKNLIIKITDQSSNPGYLSFAVLNQGDVLSAEVYDMGSQGWTSMRRVYGAVFDLANPPEGAMKVRFTVGKVYGGTTLVYSKKWIPENWRAGRTIDTGIHL
ncbi:expansin-like B1 [Ipomoea triloba]|uniref:expansin-like B1 n=1 Tax=Ipomoea triloba TaxID=35885 RepID=UPI00125E2C58|nr:expansin-like B1 [Ipomoea triloba]